MRVLKPIYTDKVTILFGINNSLVITEEGFKCSEEMAEKILRKYSSVVFEVKSESKPEESKKKKKILIEVPEKEAEPIKEENVIIEENNVFEVGELVETADDTIKDEETIIIEEKKDKKKKRRRK